MALFKISKGLKADLPQTYNEGYCYVTTDDGKFYIDTTDDEAGRIVLNADNADTASFAKLVESKVLATTSQSPYYLVGSYYSTPGSATLYKNPAVYAQAGKIYAAGFVGDLTGTADAANTLTVNAGNAMTPVYFANGVPVACSGVEADKAVYASSLISLDNSNWNLSNISTSTTNADGSKSVNGHLTFYDASTTVQLQMNAEYPASGTPTLDLWAQTGSGSQNKSVRLITADNIGEYAATSVDWSVITNKPNFNYLSLNGGTLTGNVKIANDTYPQYICANTDGTALAVFGTYSADGNFNHAFMRAYSAASVYKDATLSPDGTFTSEKVVGAVWNDYAEYREADTIEPGRVVIERGDDTMTLSQSRMQPGASIVSDTFGFAIGETSKSKTPIAVSGRVLAYTAEPRDIYQPGDPVCSGPNGTVSKMTREEVHWYPERMIGTVSAIPDYELWGTGKVAVNGRIWIKVV